KENLIAHNTDKAMNPASVIKLVTTYAGLELLGPAYSWKTDVLVGGDIKNGVLHGDLILRGTGDPRLTVERFWLLLKQLRERGLTTIKGDLVLDKTSFDVAPHDPAKFDGEPLRAYNVGPDALLVNFKSVRFAFAPTVDLKGVSISPDIKPAQLEIGNRVRLIDGPCGDWRERVVIDVQTISATQMKVSFTGNYPKSCGEKVWNVSLLDHARFTGGVFAQLWRDVGGSWSGAVKLAATPADARMIVSVESPPLAEVIRDINKYSNNVMARQLFLSLSADGTQPASVARSTELIREWLAKKNIPAPELVLENGSGLSRIERISTGTLSQMMDAAWRSSVMPEFVSSMALLGVDGTFRKRAKGDSIAGQAHVKSGTLSDARAVAGFVRDAQGRRWIVVLMINHANAPLTQAAQDALLAWVFNRP
ncbi:MAG: D-alanyl-D-alanine carboxypeptidase/D-alanyl-D-alanine-endopeptidase, partial [Betaproteobacteria bacterium]|nr:D-alanyl-D-alanine carboxypeptidase/D-alanyl-D-alanine-endopeptidase [Betaproteobacteria bacterium]